MIRADLHIHSTFSDDSEISPEDLIAHAKETGLDCVAVADHNSVAGSLRIREMKPPLTVITGEEILTLEGEIIGLFLETIVMPGLSPEETIYRIHEQGGLAYVPHPFDRFRSSAIQRNTLERIASIVDIVEIANARTLPFQDLSLPKKYADKYGKPMGAGSDAHTVAEISRAYVEMNEFTNPADFLKALASGRVHPYETSPTRQALGIAGRLARKLTGRH